MFGDVYRLLFDCYLCHFITLATVQNETGEKRTGKIFFIDSSVCFVSQHVDDGDDDRNKVPLYFFPF